MNAEQRALQSNTDALLSLLIEETDRCVQQCMKMVANCLRYWEFTPHKLEQGLAALTKLQAIQEVVRSTVTAVYRVPRP